MFKKKKKSLSERLAGLLVENRGVYWDWNPVGQNKQTNKNIWFKLHPVQV